MNFEACFRAAAVRYASVGAGVWGHAGHGRRQNERRTMAEKATDGAGGSGYTDRAPSFVPLTWYFRVPNSLPT